MTMECTLLLWFIYSVWADYINGSVSGIAFLNFESNTVVRSVVVRCHWFWLEKDEFEHA